MQKRPHLELGSLAVPASPAARWLRGALVACLLPASVSWAQVATAPADAVGEFATDLEVALVQIEVRVEDGKEFVPGLGVADFSVREDGERCEIVYVDEVNPDRQPAPGEAGLAAGLVARRTRADGTIADAPATASSLVLVVDQANSSASAIGRQRAFLRNFIRDLRGTDVTLGLFVLTIDGSFRMVSSFTRDLSVPMRAVESLHHGGAGSSDRQAKLNQLETLIDEKMNLCSNQEGAGRTLCESSVMESLIRTARAFAQEERGRASNSMEAIRAVLRFSDHLPGRRSMVLVSEGIDPGGVSYFDTVGKLMQYYSQTTAVRGTGTWLRDIQREASTFARDQPLFQRIIDMAHSSAVTVHWLNPAHGESLSAFSPEGLSGAYNAAASLVNVADPIQLLRGLTEETGGLALTKAAGVEEFYRRIGDDIQRYYVVSYTPVRANHDGGSHKVEVEVEGRKLDVRARKRYTDDEPEKRLMRNLAAALEFPDVFDAFAVEGALSYLAAAAGGYDVGVRLAIPYADVAPGVHGGTVQGTLQFGFVVRDKDDKVVASATPAIVVSQAYDRFTQLTASGAHVDFRQTFRLNPGTYSVVGAVVDANTQRAAARRLPLVLPDRGAACLSVSPILLAAATEALAAPVDGLEFDANGNALLGARRLSFAALVIQPASGQLTGLYQVVNPGRGPDGGTSLEVSFRLRRGDDFVNQTEPRKLEALADPKTGAVTSFFDVPYKGLPSGDYQLEVVAQDLRSGCSATAGAPFRIVAQTASAASPPPAGGMN